MKVLQVTPFVSRLGGGLFESVRHLSQSIQRYNNIDVEVVGLWDEKTSTDICAWAPLKVRAHKITGPKAFGYAPTMAADLAQSGADVLHLQGLWKYPSVAVRQWGRNTGKSYLISPRGMLEPWALEQSAIRKKLALALFQRASLNDAVCIHATSALEAESVRQAGFRNPIAVIPNGVETPADLQTRSAGHHDTKRALFLSRIHPKKGLLNLIEAWREVSPANWQLIIVGPDESNHLREVKAAVMKHRLEKFIFFRGEALHEAKTQLYLESDLFILPSFSENFGLVIGEALAHGLPVITTRATPWEDLQKYQCGWWIDVGIAPLVQALREATSLQSEQLQEMGLRGREFVKKNYSWKQVAEQMLEIYEWVLGWRAKPGCVQS